MQLDIRGVRNGIDGQLVDVRVVDGAVAAITPAGTATTGEAIDGAGGTLLPGLVDAHVHAVQWASARRRIPLADATSAAEVVDRVVAGAGRADEIVMGTGFRDGLWPETPHKDMLERALPGRPVALFSQDLHTCWLSPAALALVGREHPTGVLVEGECFEATIALPAASPAQLDRWVLEAGAAAAARGVTGIVDFEFADTVADWSRRASDGPLPLRVACAIARPLLDDAIARGHRTGDTVPGAGGMLTVGPFKLFVDGSLNTRTAYCYEPYPGTESEVGRLELPPGELVPLMARAAAHGLHPAVHAIGDKATTIALDAFAEVGCRGRIEHAQLVAPADVGRFAELGVVASVQPAHQPDDRDVADRYWDGRTRRAFPYAQLLASGAELVIGSDAPVSPLDPWDGIASSVTRTDDDRPAWHPEQAIPLAAALRAACGGRDAVEVGDPADLTVIAGTPTPENLRATEVLATLAAGRVTHRA